MEWSKRYCLSDHYVYLSLTSNLKVGVTRHTQIPTRWIDQGAHHAIKFAKVPNRYLAGMIEVEISKHISDRTQWRKMLQGNYNKLNLVDKNALTHFDTIFFLISRAPIVITFALLCCLLNFVDFIL